MKKLFAVILFLISSVAFGQVGNLFSGALTGTIWATYKIGAGGLITGLDIASDGTRVIRTDTYGAYKWTGSTWQQLVTFQSMPAPADATGTNEIRIAPSNTSRFYMIYNGNMFRTNNRGASWSALTNYTTVTWDPNTPAIKGFAPTLAIDPANPDVVYASTPSNGLRVSTDAGATWSVVSAVGTATTTGGFGGGHLIKFDPSSSVSGGRTQGIYVSTYGTGVYHSANAGSSWTLTTSTPTTHVHLEVGANGQVYLVANDGTDTLNIYNGTWTTKSLGGLGNPLASVAVDPSDATKITGINVAGYLSYSSDNGATWTPLNNNPAATTRTATDIPWLAWTQESFMSAADIRYDPSQSNKLFFAEGIGVWYTSPSAAVAGGTAWTSQSIGIEQLVSNKLLKPPGGALIYGAWDRPIFYSTSPNTYPSTVAGCANPQTNAIVMGWDVDYSSATPTTLYAVCNFDNGTETSAKSTDGGQTWTAYGSVPTGVPNTYVGGSIASSTSTSAIWIPCNDNLFIWITANSGTTWTHAAVTGPKTTGSEGFCSSQYVNRRIACSDRVTANKYYVYYNGTQNSNGAGTNADGAIAGIYVSTDSGANFTKAFSGRPEGNNNQGWDFDRYNFKLRCVPGNAGHLWMAAGQIGGGISGSFWRSTDAGSTISAMAGVAEVYAFGFGKQCPTKTYPAVYIAGYVSSIWGIYRSCDGDQATPTWTMIGDGYPVGNMSEIRTIEGDPDTYGTVYIGTIGAGVLYGYIP